MTERFLLVGDGRLATTLADYLPGQGIALSRWSRRAEASGEGAPLGEALNNADTVLIAIRDDAIIPWADENGLIGSHKRLVHFSGALVVDGIVGAHPLYAFPKTVVPQDVMVRVPFILDDGGPRLDDLLPGLPNPTHHIAADDRPLYHALAVLTGNLATFLWNRAAITAEDRLDLPPAALFVPYFESLIRNFETSPFDSLTGPVKRKDMETVNKNLDALRDQPALRTLYEAFLEVAWHSPPGDGDR